MSTKIQKVSGAWLLSMLSYLRKIFKGVGSRLALSPPQRLIQNKTEQTIYLRIVTFYLVVLSRMWHGGVVVIKEYFHSTDSG